MKYQLYLWVAILTFSLLTLADARVRRKKIKKTNTSTEAPPPPVTTEEAPNIVTEKKLEVLENAPNNEESSLPTKINLDPNESLNENEVPVELPSGKPRNGRRKAVKRKVDGVQNQQPDDYNTDYDYDTNYGDYNEGKGKIFLLIKFVKILKLYIYILYCYIYL